MNGTARFRTAGPSNRRAGVASVTISRGLAGKKDAEGSITIDSRWIVYAIAVGLATQWARYLKTHPGVVPPWFLAASRDDRGAFAAFLGSQAIVSGGHGGGAGGGGGAAGGGGSGAG